uniref:Queuine tRNA-ribosyltransferase accessory subunit 2 n=1 Tax=Alona affinis TaxID=381656 RepID=A0A9N6WP35_9CRUS|nr:EOG090X08JG [Alona affinis]
MKFTVNAVAKSGARIGSLTEFARIPHMVLDTPYLLLHTRGGSVPNLSYDLLQMVTKEPQMMQVPLVTLVEHAKNIGAFGKGIGEFAGLQEHLHYATMQDSGTSTPEGYHDKHAVSLWTRNGRKLIDASTYISCMEALKPDVFQMMPDSDTTPKSSAKRVKTSVDATVRFARTCSELKEKSEVLRDTPVLACLTGGFNVHERRRCIEELKEFNVSGYVIEGFHTNGLSATNMIWNDIEPILIEILAALPQDRPRIFHGPVTPILLMKLLSKGVDVVDATFPWMAAERGGALIFPNSISDSGADGMVTETLPCVKQVANTNKSHPDDQAEEEPVDRSYEINLNDKLYFNDAQPLVSGCCCYCCRKYARSYVHHLLATKELLAPMLLMMHNLHHYLNFFGSIRSAIQNDRLDDLQARLERFVASRTN